MDPRVPCRAHLRDGRQAVRHRLTPPATDRTQATHEAGDGFRFRRRPEGSMEFCAHGPIGAAGWELWGTVLHAPICAFFAPNGRCATRKMHGTGGRIWAQRAQKCTIARPDKKASVRTCRPVRSLMRAGHGRPARAVAVRAPPGLRNLDDYGIELTGPAAAIRQATGHVRPCRARPRRRLYAALRTGRTRTATGRPGPRTAPHGTPGRRTNRKRFPVSTSLRNLADTGPARERRACMVE